MIYLLRHCEKTAEAADAPLSSAGFKQAKAIVPLLASLGIKRIISNPYLRADWKAVLAHGLANPSVVALDGESAKGVWARAQTVLQPAEPTLLVTHGGCWLTVVLGRFGRPLSLKSLLDIKSPDLFSIDAERWQTHEL